jgi:hypothetical protein
MRTIWIMLATSVLAAATGVCRAENVKDLPASSAAVDANEAAKLADSLLPAADKEEPQPAGAKAPGPEAPVPQTCTPYCQTCFPCCQKCKAARCHEGFCHRLKEFLCYRPLQRPGIYGCCHKGDGCRVPPLYYYFLDNCDGYDYSGCALPRAAPGCCSGCACQGHP